MFEADENKLLDVTCEPEFRLGSELCMVIT